MNPSSPPSDTELKVQLAVELIEIRRLARQIQTPEQFDAIMAAVQDPYMQQQVRMLLTPLLPFALPETHDAPPTDV